MGHNTAFDEQKKKTFKISLKFIITATLTAKSKISFYVFFFAKKSSYLQRSTVVNLYNDHEINHSFEYIDIYIFNKC